MLREAEAERDGGMSAIGGDGDGCRKCYLAAAPAADDHAGDRASAARLADANAADGDPRLELAPRVNGMLQQHRVEIAPQDRAAPHPLRIASLDLDAALAGDAHAVHAQAARLDLARHAERTQPRERARIDRVAAQLVAWKHRAVENAHPRARASQHDPRDGARRPCADDHDVRGHARPTTMALFFDPKPRQLQSAASTPAARPSFGMTSRSQAGSGSV